MDIRHLTLEPNDVDRLSLLCGQHDSHLRLIESRLNVAIRNRGNQFEIEGDPTATAACGRLLDQLYRETRQATLTNDEVHLFLQEAAHFADADQADRKSVV